MIEASGVDAAEGEIEGRTRDAARLSLRPEALQEAVEGGLGGDGLAGVGARAPRH